jgi:Cap4 SAVED domain
MVQFLEQRGILEKDPIVALTLCAGFERGIWRQKRFVEYLFDWLPRFALKARERQYLSDAPFSQIKKALYQLYDVSRVARTSQRGEVGELLLHVCCVEHFKTAPIVLTVFYKTASNDVIKGWDCVHYRKADGGSIELWLGEAKFYEDAKPAITEAIKSIKAHIDAGFLSAQKVIVGSKIEDDFEDYDDVKKLFDLNTSLDEITKRLIVPIMITYDSAAVGLATALDDAYVAAVQAELQDLFSDLSSKHAGLELVLKAVFIPLKSKTDFVREFDEKMGIAQ